MAGMLIDRYRSQCFILYCWAASVKTRNLEEVERTDNTISTRKLLHCFHRAKHLLNKYGSLFAFDDSSESKETHCIRVH